MSPTMNDRKLTNSVSDGPKVPRIGLSACLPAAVTSNSFGSVISYLSAGGTWGGYPHVKSPSTIRIYIHTPVIRGVGKSKVTLSVDDELLREARSYLAENGLTISGTLERALSEVSASALVEKVAERLGGRLQYVSFEDVSRKRPKGLDAAKAVREARDARAEVLSR